MAVSFSLPVLQEEPSGGKLVAVPHGASIPEGATSVPEGLRMPAHVVADATQRARLSGKAVAVDIPKSAIQGASSFSDTLARKTSHRQRMTTMRDSQIGDGADQISGDGATAKRQPVDEVSRLISMLPYAFGMVAVAVVLVLCLIGRISKYVSSENSSYFAKDGSQAQHKSVPKGVGGMGRVGFRRY
mmetsp:Transcript_48899/g.153595  ORF Transcript_48899/g.153595 Transcript_48899/m.153595 type:complete len:187 (+) Transcript_48899:123-683(+)